MVCAFCYKQMIGALTSIMEITSFARSFEGSMIVSQLKQKNINMYFFLLKGGESMYFNICTFVCFCAYEYRQTSWENMNYSNFRSSAASIQMSQTFLLGPQHCNETCISAHLSIFTYHVDPSWTPWTPAASLICIYFHFFNISSLFMPFFTGRNTDNDIAFLSSHTNTNLEETLVELRKIHFLFTGR